MNEPAKRLATYEDLLDLPEHLIGEILNDELMTRPRSAPRHALAVSVIGDEFVSPYQRGRGDPGGGLEFTGDPGCRRHRLAPG